MGIILEFSLPAGAFALGDAFAADEGLEVEFDRVVPVTGRPFPFFRVATGDRRLFERHARSGPAVERLDHVEVDDEKHLYEASWGGRAATVAADVVASEGAVLEGRAASGTWNFRLRFHDRDQVREFQRACIDHGTPLDIGKLYDDDASSVRERYDLTEKQYVTLRTAYEHGYFEEPRATDLYDLGDRLDVSPRAVSQRLRRGLSAVVGDTVVVDDSPE